MRYICSNVIVWGPNGQGSAPAEYVGTNGLVRVYYAGTSVDYSACVRIYRYRIGDTVYEFPFDWNDEERDPMEHDFATCLEFLVNSVLRQRSDNSGPPT